MGPNALLVKAAAMIQRSGERAVIKANAANMHSNIVAGVFHGTQRGSETSVSNAGIGTVLKAAGQDKVSYLLKNSASKLASVFQTGHKSATIATATAPLYVFFFF